MRNRLAIVIAFAASAVQAGWLDQQPASDPVHAAVDYVAQFSCTVTSADLVGVFATHGASAEEAADHIAGMLQAGEVTTPDGGTTLTFVGVAGC